MVLLKIVSGQKPREIALRVLARRKNREFTEDLLEAALAPGRLFARRPASVPGAGLWRGPLAGDAGLAGGAEDEGPDAETETAGSAAAWALPDFLARSHPNHAAVHETVELAKQSGFGPQAGFVNALLRGCLRSSTSRSACWQT